MATYALRRGVGLVTLRNPPVNGLSLAVRDGILRALDSADRDKCVAVVIMGDGKTFPAGADITEFVKGTFSVEPDLNQVINYMDDYDKPLVACIHGTALGGGLEIALACHWRMCAHSSKLGLPEVNLGILPGAGGTQRLPRLTGFRKAVSLITSGRMISSEEALSLGIVDKVFDLPKGFSSNTLEDIGLEFALNDAVQSTSVEDRRLSSRPVPETDGPCSENVLQEVLGDVLKNSRGFVAPFSIVKAVAAASSSKSFQEGLHIERSLFKDLMRGPQAKALQYFFFAERKCAKLPELPECVPALELSKVGIVGGGTMGTGIAMNFLNCGIPVTLVDTTRESADAAKMRIRTTYEMSSAFKKGVVTVDMVSHKLSLLSTSADIRDLGEADLVIEAAFENMPIKKAIFEQIDAVCKPGALMASNTSYLSIDEIAQSTSRPTNIVGMHFFSPANVMKLLEVVRGKHTSNESVAAAIKIGKKIGKVAVVSGNCYGFIGNRMLRSYCEEAVYLVEEGASPAQVDAALKGKLGMAMGLFEMMDLAGLDVGWRQRTELGLTKVENRNPRFRYSTLMDKLCEQGYFGQKTARGWYSYSATSPRAPVPCPEIEAIIDAHREEHGFKIRQISDEEIIERCMYPLVNEGFKILEEGISLRPDDIDVVYVYGYGFPRYRGGPMWWAEREVGLQKVLSTMTKYEELYPTVSHWQPARLLQSAVAAGASIKEELFFFREAKNKKSN